MRHVYKEHQKLIARDFGASSFEALLASWYRDESMSSHEIVERIQSYTQFSITPRSVQRILKRLGIVRNAKQSFNLAISRGRVEWAYKAIKAKRYKIAKIKRYSILKRDGFKCVLCGATAQTTILEVDHVIAIANGGTNSDDNLRTLCHECNVGKGRS